jgi:hypothetical protein
LLSCSRWLSRAVNRRACARLSWPLLWLRTSGISAWSDDGGSLHASARQSSYTMRGMTPFKGRRAKAGRSGTDDVKGTQRLPWLARAEVDTSSGTTRARGVRIRLPLYTARQARREPFLASDGRRRGSGGFSPQPTRTPPTGKACPAVTIGAPADARPSTRSLAWSCSTSRRILTRLRPASPSRECVLALIEAEATPLQLPPKFGIMRKPHLKLGVYPHHEVACRRDLVVPR